MLRGMQNFKGQQTKRFTNKEHKAFSWGGKAWVDGLHAVDYWSLEVNIENAEHVNCVEYYSENDQPSFSSSEKLSSDSKNGRLS